MIDDAARDYIAALGPERRPLFDRVHRLILDVHPDADVVLSYQMPTYVVGDYRLYVGVWKHWLSFYAGSLAVMAASAHTTRTWSPTRESAESTPHLPH